jgi:predicted outer membrane protein
MSFLTKISAGLLVSTLSLTAQAAQPEAGQQNPVQEPGQAPVEVTNVAEVIQVLHAGIESEKQIIEIVRTRHPDVSLQHFIDALAEDVLVVDQKLEELAASKDVQLAPDQLTQNAKAILEQFSQEVEDLSQKSDADFREAVIAVLISRHEKAINLYEQVELASLDEAVKAAVLEFRPLVQKHLETAQQLQKQTTKPSKPGQPSQSIDSWVL